MSSEERGQSPAERGMGLGLRTLNRLAGSELLDRARLRKPLERALYQGTRGGFRTAGAASRTFSAASKLRAPRASGPRPHQRAVRHLTPTTSSRCCATPSPPSPPSSCARSRSPPTMPRTTPAELLAQANELGVSMLGVPEELGGVMAEQSAATGVLVAEALAHGDMGIALAALAPAAVATALGLWGDADQQATYLPAFTGENVPAAALALLEPRALFDPLTLTDQGHAARTTAGYSTASSRSSRAPPRPSCSSIAADARGTRSGAVHRRVRHRGPVRRRTSRPWGCAPPRPAASRSRTCRLPAAALLGGGEPRRATASASSARASRWCALAVGTAQAVLDYVIPYVNERNAFGEPITNRQAVAFTVANIAIELEGMRLLTYRAARPRRSAAEPFAREAALARRLCAEHGHADRLRRGPAARRPRLRQGASGRALVPRPARRAG